MKLKFTVLMGCVLSILSIGLSLAQGTCPTLVEQALQAMGDNCEGVGRNNACYGYNLVSAEFSDAVSEDFFAQPADTASLDILESIQTAAMNADQSQWGVAVMNLQANIPNSLPGQSVKFILLGDVEVESAVEPSEGFESIDGIEAVAASTVNIRGGAGLDFNVISGLSQGDTVLVDGQSTDGEWYRTVVGNRIGWISSSLLEPDDALADLPVIDGKQRTSMQSFYLRTGFGSPACEEAPEDTLLIQGPEGIEIDFTVNGADIRIGSTITIRILPPGDIMEITVVDGKVIIPGGAPDGGDLVFYENYRVTTCLTDPDDLGVDGNDNDRVVGCDWSEPEFVPDAILGGSYCSFQSIPSDVLNYSINVQCPGEEPIVIILDDEPPSNDPPEDDTNLCAEGNAWDDGRCTSDLWWELGFYYGLVEEGIIDEEDIPEQYVEPTPEPTEEPEDEKEKPKICSEYYGGEGDSWDIYNNLTGDYIDTVYTNPRVGDCGFTYEEG